MIKATPKLGFVLGFRALAISFLAASVLSSVSAHAEGDGGGNPSAIPPPPPPPSGFQPPPQEFQEEDDFVDSTQNFGFTPPNNPSPVLPDNSNQANPLPTDPGTNSGSTAGALPKYSPTTPSPAGKSAAKPGKRAPKLADYLELDNSVKSLEVKNFDLPDKDIKDVVTLISKWTGKNFILDNKVRGKITIIGPSQVTLQEAYQAFLSALEANGLTTVQAGKFIRIIESAEARRAPVETYAGDYAPNTDQFITRIFQLKYINADEVQREFRDLTTRQGKLFAYEPTNSIIITDTGSNIRRIEDILRTLDVKSFETTLHVVKIRHTSAKIISEMLGEIYGEGKGGAAGGARNFRRSALERTRGGGQITKIIPDEATNSLVVLANKAGIVQLMQLVSKLDVKVTDTGRIHVYYCEYAKAEDLASTLASLAGGAGGAKNTSGRNTKVASPTTPGGAPGGAAPSGPVTAELEGGVKITSDAATNSLVITANASDYQTLKRVIRKLDIPRLQVFVETAILEVSLSDKTKVGVNSVIGVPNQGFGGGFVGDSDTLNKVFTKSGLPDGATLPIFAGPSFAASITGAGGASTPITVSTFMGFLNLLTQTSNTSVLSTPQIIALDNEKAEFKVLDEIPVQTSLVSGTATAPGTATGTIERLKTGIEIKLTRHGNAASRTIRMEIEQKVDNVKANSEVPQALAQVQRATTSRMTNTSVVVRDQDFVMLGGLMSDKVDESISKMPLLGDIPVLGWLFKSRIYSVIKTNLIILLHPRIIGTSLDSANVIDESLQKRTEFIDRNMGGDDEFSDQAADYRQKIMDQARRGKRERPFNYQNHMQDDEGESKKPTTRSESRFDSAPPNEKSAKKTEAPAVSAPNNDEPEPVVKPQTDAPLLPESEPKDLKTPKG